MRGHTRSAVKGVVGVLAAVAMPLGLFSSALAASPPARADQTIDLTQNVVIGADAAPPSVAPAIPTTTTSIVPEPNPNDFSSGWEQRWGQAALAGISYPWAQLGYSVHFLSGRPGLLAKTIPSSKTIEVYVRKGESFDRMRHALAHELGHALDLTYNDAARRAQWMQLRGISQALPWFIWGGRDYASPAGDYAETFAFWQAGPSDYSDFGPPAALAPLTRFFYPNP